MREASRSPYRRVRRARLTRPDSGRRSRGRRRGTDRRRAAGALAVSWLTAGVLVRWRVGRVVVRGSSMVPTLMPGDHLVVWRSRDVREGDLVALRDPEVVDRVLLKRVIALRGQEVEVRGDNGGASRDSRDFGPVARSDVLGRVVYRYVPLERRGPLGRSICARS